MPLQLVWIQEFSQDYLFLTISERRRSPALGAMKYMGSVSLEHSLKKIILHITFLIGVRKEARVLGRPDVSETLWMSPRWQRWQNVAANVVSLDTITRGVLTTRYMMMPRQDLLEIPQMEHHLISCLLILDDPCRPRVLVLGDRCLHV
jgi:hypothetical protein